MEAAVDCNATQVEHRAWKAEQKLGASERRQFHKAAKRRVVERLMRPSLLDQVKDAIMSAIAYLGNTKNDGEEVKKRRGKKGVNDQGATDLEAGEAATVDEEETEGGGGERAGGGGDSDDEEDESKTGKALANRATSSRKATALSEAETEADRIGPPPDPDSDDD